MSAWFRRTLSVAVFVNIAGAIIFFPAFSFLRNLLGFPLSHSFYLFVLSLWILLFAAFFYWMLSENSVNKGVLLLSALGKLSFAALIVVFVFKGQFGFLAAMAALTDTVLAALFLGYLRLEYLREK